MGHLFSSSLLPFDSNKRPIGRHDGYGNHVDETFWPAAQRWRESAFPTAETFTRDNNAIGSPLDAHRKVRRHIPVAGVVLGRPAYVGTRLSCRGCAVRPGKLERLGVGSAIKKHEGENHQKQT